MTTNKALKMSQIVVVKYLFKEDWAPLEEVLSKSSKEFGDIYDVESENDVIQVVNTSPATLILAAVTGKDELTKVLSFLKAQRRLIKESNVKVSVVNYLNNKQVETALMKLGCQEVMEPSIRGKALKFKLDFWKKALSLGMNKSMENKSAGKEKTNANEAKADSKASEAPQIKWIEPLKLVDDMWICKQQQDVKKVLSRWMVKLMGPSPFVAQWTEVPGQKGIWKFVFKDGIRENFHAADGDWIFSGDQKPEFIWKENLWLVSGQKFQLFYQEEGETSYRFRASAQGVEICKNSSYGLSREKAIIESFDQEVLVKKGLLDNSKNEIAKDEEGKDGLLTQDISEDQKLDGKLKGKVALEVPDAPADPKKLSVDRAAGGHYSGATETDNLGEGNYDGVVDLDKQRKAKQNKNSAGADSFGNDGGDAGTDDVGPAKYKGKLKHEHSDRQSNYGGESETDDLGSSNWSNKSEGSVEAKKKKRSSQDEESDLFDDESEESKKSGPGKAKRSKDYSGESETEDLGGAHWGGTKKSSARDGASEEKNKASSGEIEWDEEDSEDDLLSTSKKKAKRDRERGEWSEEEGQGLSGKSSTDDLGDDFYSGNVESKKKRVQAASDKSFGDESESGFEDESSDWADGSSQSGKKKKSRPGTDDLGSDHYSGKVGRKDSDESEEDDFARASKKKSAKGNKSSSYEEETHDDYGGKSSTDDIGASHYKGKSGQAKYETDEDDVDEESSTQEFGSKQGKRPQPIFDKKMNMLDDLLPDGNAEDPMETVVPLNFDDAPKVNVPVERSKPRLVSSQTNEEAESEESGGSQLKGKKYSDSTPKVPVVSDIAPVGDDGKPVVNSNAKVSVILKRKVAPKVEYIASIDDFFDGLGIFKLSYDISPGDQVELMLTFEYMNKSKRINVAGVCTEVDSDGEGSFFTTVKFDGTDLKMFEQFMLLYQLRQQHVSQFIKAAKGL